VPNHRRTTKPKEPPKVKLFETKGSTSVTIWADVFEDNIRVGGEDFGEAPSAVWGSSSYEYGVAISKKDKPKLLEALNQYSQMQGIVIPSIYRLDEDGRILLLLQLTFGGKTSAFEDVRGFLIDHQIPYEFSSYF
jgi:hypothetical protein